MFIQHVLLTTQHLPRFEHPPELEGEIALLILNYSQTVIQSVRDHGASVGELQTFNVTRQNSRGVEVHVLSAE